MKKTTRLIQKAGVLILAPMFALLTACGGANNPAFENADMEMLSSKPVDFMPGGNAAVASDTAAAADAAIAADAAAAATSAATATTPAAAPGAGIATGAPGTAPTPAAAGADNGGAMDAARAAANAAAIQGDMGATASQQAQPQVSGDGSAPTVVTEVVSTAPVTAQ
jgi:hypothetical protein